MSWPEPEDAATTALRGLLEHEVTRSLWGQPQTFTPRVLGRVLGDGKQLIGFETFDSRPAYWIVRVDSAWDLDNYGKDDLLVDHTDDIYEAVEEEFGSAHCFECGNHYGWLGENWDYNPCDACWDIPESEGEFPALCDSTGGCSWFSLDWPAEQPK